MGNPYYNHRGQSPCNMPYGQRPATAGTPHLNKEGSQQLDSPHAYMSYCPYFWKTHGSLLRFSKDRNTTLNPMCSLNVALPTIFNIESSSYGECNTAESDRQNCLHTPAWTSSFSRRSSRACHVPAPKDSTAIPRKPSNPLLKGS